MDKIIKIMLILSIFLLFSSLLSGCLEKENNNDEIENTLFLDKTMILPNWKDNNFHDYDKTTSFLKNLNKNYPEYVEVFSIGKSVENRDIYCIRITNESKNREKFSCLIDGCIHGCEWEAGESCLYLSEFLLINSKHNESIKNILDKSEIYIVPLVNPDSREKDSRFNSKGIDLCRNFDIDFGRMRGSAIRLGQFLGRKGLSVVRIPFFGTMNNCGWKPFSEPETKAISNLMQQINKKNEFSFYVNCHTAIHNFFAPWSAYKPPFEINEKKKELFDYTMQWISENSEYENKELHYHASGTATDWCFKEFDVPCFTFELLSTDYEPWLGGGKHDNLVHWMKTTVPVFMFMLVNIENFYNWETPNIQPVLPSGIPPEPIK